MSYDYNGYNNATGPTSSSPVGLVILLMMAIMLISILVSRWFIFKKAGKKGWEALVPIYNIIVLVDLVELPVLYVALYFIPLINLYALFKVNRELAKKFRKSPNFGLGLAFLPFIFMPMLAFSKDTYIGKVTDGNYNPNPNPNPNSNVYYNNAMYQNSGVTNMNAGYPNNNVNYGTQMPYYNQNANMPNMQNQPSQMNTYNNQQDYMNNGYNNMNMPNIQSQMPQNNVNPPLQPVGFQPDGVVGNMENANMQSSKINNGVNLNQMPNNAYQAQNMGVMSNGQVAGGQSVNMENTQMNSPQPPSNSNINQTVLGPQSQKFCPNCGAQMDANVGTCFMCGHKF